MRRRARHIARPFAGLMLLAAASVPLPAMAAGHAAASLPEQSYDMRAQPLAAALAAFARISHVDIIYDDALAAGRLAAPVVGILTPQQALAQLLTGTGLSWRFTRPSAALVYAPQAATPSAGGAGGGAPPVLTLDMMHVRAAPIVGSLSDAVFQAYGRRVLGTIDRRLRPDAIANRRNYRTAVRLWIDGEGAVTHADFAGDDDTSPEERHILAQIAALQFGAPPAGLPQPLRIQLEAR